MLLRLLSDDQLAWLISRGDASAFGEFFERYHERIRGFCRARIKEDQAVDDAVSDAFIQVWKMIVVDEKPLTDGLHLKRLLYKAAYFLILTYWQKNGHHVSLDALIEGGKEEIIGEEKKLEFPDVPLPEIESGLDKLDISSREAIRLKYYEGFNNQEISEILEISPNAVAARLYRGLKNLKDQLATHS